MMNVSRRQKGYEPRETPHFFKIILSDTLQSGKLMIPKRFVAKYGHRLPNQLLLKVAGDANWPVELEKSDERVWICKGWRNFLDYYSINLGNLIVFRLEGASFFHVLIFNESASEIEYPRKPIAPAKLLDPEMVKIDDVSTELGEHIVLPGERRELKSPLCSASPDKLMMKSNLVSEDRSRIKESEKRATPFEQLRLSSTCPNPPDALKKARKFKSEHPSFLIVVRCCYLEHSKVNVPSGFLKSQIRKSLVVKDATLEFRGRSWTVKFFNYPKHYCGELRAGWAMFATDNSLSTGDVCVFELIKKTPMVFRVSIFRHAG